MATHTTPEGRRVLPLCIEGRNIIDSKTYPRKVRAAAAVDFHCNASLATLNLVRAADLGMPQGQEPHVFSMASWKQCHFNERLVDVFIEKFALDPTWVKNHACYEKLRAYGAIAA